MIFTANSQRRFLLFVALSLAALTVLMAACGGDDDDNGGAATTPATSTAATATPAASSAAATTPATSSETIDVTLSSFKFEPAAITVSAGETVTFNLTNAASAPHNMRIAGPDGQFETDDDTLHLEVRAGTTSPLTYTAPDEAGEIIFRCDFHPALMMGTITVE